MLRQQGKIIGNYGRRFDVRTPDEQIVRCVTRSKKTSFACGDIVNIAYSSEQELSGVIEDHLPRSSLLYRSDQFKSKLIAANITQVMIVVACDPPFSTELLARCLIAASNQNLSIQIVLNKVDLNEATESAWHQLRFYNQHFNIIPLSALYDDPSTLSSCLQGHLTVLVGQSGMGKSTLINALIPDAAVATQATSKALHSGKHTTTHSRLYQLPELQAEIIDCPGVQAFGLSHLSTAEIENEFHEFRPFLGHCRFHNCRHRQEPGCAIKEALKEQKIEAERLKLYYQLTENIKKR